MTERASLPRSTSMSTLPPPGPIRLAAWQEWLVLGVLAGLVITGAVWLSYHFLLAAELMGTHPAEAWSMRVHGGLAMTALIVIGALLPRHVSGAWRHRRNRGSGVAMLGTLGLLALSGWLLYYVASPELRTAASWLHWGIGLAVPLLMAWHLVRGGRWRRGA